jgi:putative endonuclease
MTRQFYVYILANQHNTVLYVGVTNDLARRVWEHKNSFVDGFTGRYKVNRLVYYEVCEDVTGAIAREKQIKAGSRADKVALIESINSDWHDLYDHLL